MEERQQEIIILLDHNINSLKSSLEIPDVHFGGDRISKSRDIVIKGRKIEKYLNELEELEHKINQ